MWLFQYLLGIFIGYYFMSLFTTHRLSDLVNRSVMWLVRFIFNRQQQVEEISFARKPIISTPVIDETTVSKLGSYIGGIPVSQEQLDRWLQNNPNLKVSKRRE